MDSALFVFASKVGQLFVYPLSLACLLVLFGWLSASRRRWHSAALGGAVLLLWLGGSRWVAVSLVRSLESRYPALADPASAPAIVVLGGGTFPAVPPRSSVELGGSGDRLLEAVRLYRAGKAPRIVVSSGRVGWSANQGPESADMVEVLEFLGVPRGAILEESRSRNTFENAVETRRLLAPQGVDHVLLVTSALHMPRAIALFRCAGFDAVPVPAGFTVSDNDWGGFNDGSLEGVLLGLLPDAENLVNTTRALKEYLGLALSRLSRVAC
jgi:uncharacterized SAM-binding protein YcdF (DUF218 family)